MPEVFYPTKKLKEASKNKPIISYIPEDGRDPDPSWDHISRSLWPTTLENVSSRQALSEILMYACNDPTIEGASPQTAIIMARMCQRLMGRSWMERWLWDNQMGLKKRVAKNHANYGKGFFSRWWQKRGRERL